jgi:hypothetical protein
VTDVSFAPRVGEGWTVEGEPATAERLEPVPVGPLKVRLRVPEDLDGSVRYLLAWREAEPSVRDGWLNFEIPLIRDHEVIVVG